MTTAPLLSQQQLAQLMVMAQLLGNPQAMQSALKAAGTTTNTFSLHGPGGLFSTPTTHDTVINAQVSPLSGLAARLPYRPNMYWNDVQDYYTGTTANTGSQNTTACADGKQVGDLKTCRLSTPFGRMSIESKPMQLDIIGRMLNRGDFLDYRLIGNPFENIPSAQAINPAQIIRDDVQQRLAAMWIGWFYEYGALPYNGNPANTTGNTGYQEYRGLETLVNTGMTDVSGVACAGLDAIIENAASKDIIAEGTYYFNLMNGLYTYQKQLGARTLKAPVEFAWVMPRGAFEALTSIWPCNYLNGGCSINNGEQTIPGKDLVDQRDAMRQGMFLRMAGGDQVEVIVDERQPETEVTGTFTSSIYLLPLRSPAMTDSGGNITYMEYFDFNGPLGVAGAIQTLGYDADFKVIGNGRFLLHKKPPTNECVQLRMTDWERLILRTPFLAARIQNVSYTMFYKHDRSPIPGNTYNIGGGVLTRV
jgi:hypothetical protein